MPVDTTERNFGPDDPEYFIAELARTGETASAHRASPPDDSADGGAPQDECPADSEPSDDGRG
ncbi:hypothetical protein VSH64_18815 [Amycolatopsis rhabdoformis]|uniref:Uncharacterized protein n=1 Tax=Amycolatopsis rhabdoformis TaxID=1448059 RepID=A0ABZ1II48_9PSEU|nr:hypothetical protein [Amycolatopsis rhabdoformis]WSE34124.1 hypothetical protein VSH64_18815 [Amycolatopsis rhabdoformis]